MQKNTRKIKFKNYRDNLEKEISNPKNKKTNSVKVHSNYNFVDTSSTTTLPLKEVIDSINETQVNKKNINYKRIIFYVLIGLGICFGIALIVIVGIAAFRK